MCISRKESFFTFRSVSIFGIFLGIFWEFLGFFPRKCTGFLSSNLPLGGSLVAMMDELIEARCCHCEEFLCWNPLLSTIWYLLLIALLRNEQSMENMRKFCSRFYLAMLSTVPPNYEYLGGTGPAQLRILGRDRSRPITNTWAGLVPPNYKYLGGTGPAQ